MRLNPSLRSEQGAEAERITDCMHKATHTFVLVTCNSDHREESSRFD